MSVCAICGLEHPDGWQGWLPVEDVPEFVRAARLAADPQLALWDDEIPDREVPA